MAQKNPYLSIVIPAYNEEKRIGNAIKKVKEFFQKKEISFEIIVVDDGSADQTVREARRVSRGLKKFQIIFHPKNLGKGAAVKTGVLAAKGGYILFTDADMSVPIEEFDKLWKHILLGYDVVAASRGKPGARILKHQSLPRELLSKFFGVITKRFVLAGISDPQCGFKLFKSSIGKRVFPLVRTPGALFDIEFILAANRAAARIKEVPTIWVHDPDTRIKYNLLSSIKVLLELIKIKVRWRILQPIKISQE